MPSVAEPPTVPFTLQFTAVLEFPVTVALNCAVLPARTFAVVGVTDTVVEPDVGDVGLDGEVGLLEPVDDVVVVFAIPPHAAATSAKSTGNICAACANVNFSVRFADRIAWTHLKWIYR